MRPQASTVIWPSAPLTAPSGPTFPSTGLVGYWKMDESSGTRNDQTANANHLTDHNTVGSATGKLGNCATFVSASTQYLTHADASAFQMGTGSFSVALWVKTTSFPAAKSSLFEYGASDTSTGFSLKLNFSRNILLEAFDASHFIATTPATDVGTGAWRFIVAVFDRTGNMAIYIDNTADQTASLSTLTGSVNNTNGLGIGGRYDAGNLFDGSIDEVGLWNLALTTTNITTLWNSGSGLTYP